MKSTPSTPDRCKMLITQWRKNLTFSCLEEAQLKGEIKALDRQIERLHQKHIRIVAFGRVGVGKSSLLNALLKKPFFATDVAHGCTRSTKAVTWNQTVQALKKVELIDTPGIDEISAEGRARLASRIATQADFIMLVLNSDITSVELEALQVLLKSGKPVQLVLNCCDQWSKDELTKLIQSISARLPACARKLKLQVVAAAPRKAHIQKNGFVRSHRSKPIISSLQNALINLLEGQGELLLALNTLRQADHFYNSLKKGRLTRSRSAAQGLIGKFAAIKASGVAASPLLMLDFAGGLACDAALVIQLSKLYGLQMGGHGARQMMKRLSLHNSFLGGTQLGIQFILGIMRQLLIIATPVTAGISLGAAAPVALAQAALAVHTTQLTGRLAAKELLLGSQHREFHPKAMLKRLAAHDPEVKQWLGSWPGVKTRKLNKLISLLP